MYKLPLLLAAAGEALPPLVAPTPTTKLLGWNLRDMMLLLGVMVVLVNVLVLWVYFTRRNKRRELGAFSRTVHHAERQASSQGSGSGGSHRRHRRKRRRHNHPDHWPRNPTLAEAGGLPPLRPDDLESK